MLRVHNFTISLDGFGGGPDQSRDNPLRVGDGKRGPQHVWPDADALRSYSGEVAARHAALKLAGLEEAPCQFAVLSDNATETAVAWGE